MNHKLKIILERNFGKSISVPSNPDELRFDCPFCIKHGKTPDTKGHLYINTRKLVGQCFRCGHKVKIDENKIKSTDIPVREDRIEKKERKRLYRLPKCTKLEKDTAGYEYLVGRFSGLISEFEIEQRIEELGIKFCVDENVRRHYGRILFPVFYYDKLVGFQTRSIYGEDPKYLTENIGDFNVKDYLFNFNNALGNKRVYVFEGPLDVFPCGNECVAVMGKELKKNQIRLLSNNWKEIVVCLDSDAVMFAENVAKRLINIVDKLGVVLLESGDPGELGMKIYGNEVYWVRSVFDLIELRNFALKLSGKYELI